MDLSIANKECTNVSTYTNKTISEPTEPTCIIHLDPQCHFGEHRHIPKYWFVTLLLLSALTAIVGNIVVIIVVVKIRRTLVSTDTYPNIAS